MITTFFCPHKPAGLFSIYNVFQIVIISVKAFLSDAEGL